MFNRQSAQQKAAKRAAKTFSSETIGQVNPEGLEKVDMGKTVASMDKIRAMIQKYSNDITGDGDAARKMKSLLGEVLDKLTQVIEERANADDKILKLNDVATKLQAIATKFKTLNRIFTMRKKENVRREIKGDAMALKNELDNIRDTFDNGRDPAYQAIKTDVAGILQKLDKGEGRKKLLNIDADAGEINTHIEPEKTKWFGLFGGKKTRKQRNRRTRRKAKKNRRTRRNRA